MYYLIFSICIETLKNVLANIYEVIININCDVDRK